MAEDQCSSSDDRLEVEGSGSDLRLEDYNKISSGCLGEVNDDRLRGNRGVRLLIDLFSKGGAGETLF
jgi:hypothetical protein